MITVSMVWITPLFAATSAANALAPLTVTSYAVARVMPLRLSMLFGLDGDAALRLEVELFVLARIAQRIGHHTAVAHRVINGAMQMPVQP